MRWFWNDKQRFQRAFYRRYRNGDRRKLIQNGCLEDVDFLKTAHHGSRYSTGAEFLEIVRPELAVVSCSATNTYGHPSPDTLERLKKSGSRVLITRDCGAVTIVNGKSVSAFNRIK